MTATRAVPHTRTGTHALEVLAACRMLRRYLGMPAEVNGVAADGLVLAAAPDVAGFCRLHLYSLGDVLSWYRKVSEGPTRWGQTLNEAMAEHAHLLRPF
jgi:hypothetical protein